MDRSRNDRNSMNSRNMEKIQEVESEYEVSKFISESQNKVAYHIVLQQIVEVDGVVVIEEETDQLIFCNQTIKNLLHVEKDQVLEELYKLRELQNN